MTKAEAKKQLMKIASTVDDSKLSSKALSLADSIMDYPSVDDVYFTEVRHISCQAHKSNKKYFSWRGNVYKLDKDYAGDFDSQPVCSVLEVDGIEKYTSKRPDDFGEKWIDYPWKND